MTMSDGPYLRVPAWVIIGIGSAVTLGAIVWTSTLYDGHGEPVLDQPLALVLVAFLGLVGTMLSLIYKRTREVKDQVSNHHVDDSGRPVLMRNEQDERHEELVRRLDDVVSEQRATRRDVGGMREEIRGLTAITRLNSDRITTVERRQDDGIRRLNNLEGKKK